MRIFSLLLSMIGIILVMSCASKKSKTPELINDIKDKELASEIILNYRLEKKTIQDTFNISIDEALGEKFSLPEYDIVMKLSKPGDATVEIEGKNILVNVPINIVVEKKTFLTTLKAQGTLEMTFLSNFDIDKRWNLKTNTQLSHHRWIEKPKLGVAGINIPIQYISDNVLKRSKSEIEKTIDQSIKENFQLQKSMAETITSISKPQKFSPTILAWVQFEPEIFNLSPIKNSRFTARGKVRMLGSTKFSTFEPKIAFKNGILPSVNWSDDIADSSSIRIISEIKTYDINTMLKENIEGQTFSSDGKSISLSNIVTNCDYTNFRVAADISGSINGQMLIAALPKYDKLTNKFELKIIDIKLKTKNVLHKAVAWIAEGKIRNEIEKRLIFNIDDQIVEVQKTINEYSKTLKEQHDMETNIKIGKVIIENYELTPGKIEAILLAKIYIDVHINDLQKFSKLGF